MTPKRPPGLLTIGEACELSGFATSALRFYESIDLLEPDWVDPYTGYRYFHTNKLLFLNFLKSMKENGLGLSSLKPLVPSPDAGALQSAIANRAKSVRLQIRTLRRQLRWLTEAGDKLAQLGQSPMPPRIEMVPDRLVVEFTGSYDFQGYARARHALVSRMNRWGIPWKDDFCVELPLSPTGSPGLDPAIYYLEVVSPEAPPEGARLRPGRPCAVELIPGPIAEVFQRAEGLSSWIRSQGLAPQGWIEMRHVVSTAHTSNTADFRTELRISLQE
jgi:DNA-binding transcriptional MerR regulator